MRTLGPNGFGNKSTEQSFLLDEPTKWDSRSLAPVLPGSHWPCQVHDDGARNGRQSCAFG